MFPSHDPSQYESLLEVIKFDGEIFDPTKEQKNAKVFIAVSQMGFIGDERGNIGY